MGEEGFGLPIGFHFRPSDRELIESFLKPQILGQPSLCTIRERQIYGDSANPWDVFVPEILDGKFKKKDGVYVFVRLQRKIKMSFRKHFDRIAGCGAWIATTHKPIVVYGKKVGVKRSLVFKMYDTDDNRRRLLLDPPHHWSMIEYSVPDGFPNPHDLVLCFVSVDYSKSPKIKRGRRKPFSVDDDLDKKKSQGIKKEVAVKGDTRKGKSRADDQDDYVVPIFNNVGATTCISGVYDCGLKNKGKMMVFRKGDGKIKEEMRGDVVIIHDDEEALGLTSISYDDKANNRLGVIQMEQNHCVGSLASANASPFGVEGQGSSTSLMLQQENSSVIVDEEFQSEYDVNILGGDGSFQVMQDSFRLEDKNGSGVGCAGDYQVNMDPVGKDVVECSGEKNVQEFQEKYFIDNLDLDELVSYLDFGKRPWPMLYKQADEQLQGGESHGGQLAEEQNKGTNDVTGLSRKRCEDQDSDVMKKFSGSH